MGGRSGHDRYFSEILIWRDFASAPRRDFVLKSKIFAETPRALARRGWGWAHQHDLCIRPSSESYSGLTKPPLRLHPAETLPLRPEVSFYTQFPGPCDNDFYSSCPCLSFDTTENKSTPKLSNKGPCLYCCTEVWSALFFCFFSHSKMSSSYPKKLCLWHPIIKVEVWIRGDRRRRGLKKKPGGLLGT